MLDEKKTIAPISIAEVATATQTLPAVPFKWRSRDGEFHPIDKMETRHLWYVVRMVWNHSMPIEARSPFYHRYSFSPFYTAAYMRQALRAIMRELSKRTDMEQEWLDELARFAAYLRKIEPDLQIAPPAGHA